MRAQTKTKKNRGKILVDGSVGLDMIFSIENSIKETIQIKNGHLLKQNLMFTAKEKKEYFGGTGGNICYGLGLLGAKPILFSLAGKDFNLNYLDHLANKGVDLKVCIDNLSYTANFYGITDPAGEQIGIWQPNAYSKIDKLKLSTFLSKKSFKEISIAIFAPGSPKSIRLHLEEFKKNASVYALAVFDPGQSVIYFKKKDLLKCLLLSDLFIANEIEFNHAEKILKFNLKNYLIKKKKNYIETKGENGSEGYWRGVKFQTPVVKPKVIAEPTGAGDAFRAGLLFGIWIGMSIDQACLLGAKMASRNLEYYGCQEYKI